MLKKLQKYWIRLKNTPALYPVFAVLFNKYVLIVLIFAVWMLFLDTNSYLIHRELDQEIKELENNKEYYQDEITKDQKDIKLLKDSTELEKFAREQYYMKKEDEEIFIIEYQDSI